MPGNLRPGPDACPGAGNPQNGCDEKTFDPRDRGLARCSRGGGLRREERARPRRDPPAAATAGAATVPTSPAGGTGGGGTEAGGQQGAGAEQGGGGEQAGGGTAASAGARARAIEATVRDYVAALDARNGKRVCELFVPGAIEEVKLPQRKGSCAASLRASIGYEDPRGLPVWKGATVNQVTSKIARNDARAVATVVTEFADRAQPSVEDDVIYLARSGRLWKIAKPSSTLYRAVGIADVPPSVISPP